VSLHGNQPLGLKKKKEAAVLFHHICGMLGTYITVTCVNVGIWTFYYASAIEGVEKYGTWVP